MAYKSEDLVFTLTKHFRRSRKLARQLQFMQFVDESVVPHFFEGFRYVEDFRADIFPRVLNSSLIGGFY